MLCLFLAWLPGIGLGLTSSGAFALDAVLFRRSGDGQTLSNASLFGRPSGATSRGEW
jgi:hypothetical protein